MAHVKYLRIEFAALKHLKLLICSLSINLYIQAIEKQALHYVSILRLQREVQEQFLFMGPKIHCDVAILR